MTAWRTSALLFLLLLWGTNPILAADVFRARQSGAGGNFSSLDNCIETSVSLIAFERVERDPPNAPQPSAELVMGIFQFNQCAGIFLPSRSGRAAGSDVTFEIDARLNAATVAGTVTLLDDNGVSSVVTVKVSWTAVEPAVYDTIQTQIHQPGFTYNSRFQGSERRAAASATILDGVINITPKPAHRASIDQFREAFVTVGVFEEAGGQRRPPP